MKVFQIDLVLNKLIRSIKHIDDFSSYVYLHLHSTQLLTLLLHSKIEMGLHCLTHAVCSFVCLATVTSSDDIAKKKN